MRNVPCVSDCMFASLKRVISEHFNIILAAGVVGALFGLGFGGAIGAPAGAGVGMLLATIYGYVPRMTDCVGQCPIR